MDKRLQKIIEYFHEDAGFAGAPTNNASGGAIAGLPPDCLLYTSDAADE